MNRYLALLITTMVGTLSAIGLHAQTATLLPNAIQYFMDNNGKPLANGKVFFYVPPGSTPKTVWSDPGETTPITQPVPLGTSGRPAVPIYGDGVYRQVVKDQFNNVIWDFNTASTGSGGGGTSVAFSEGVMVGTIIPWANMALPSKYLYTAGQEVSRSTFAQLFTALTFNVNISCSVGIATITVDSTVSDKVTIGTPVEFSCFAPHTVVISKTNGQLTLSSPATVTASVNGTILPWGNGDGATTFNIPDLRGAVIVGRNNMIGTGGRLSSTYYGVDPNGIGSAGGSQSGTIAQANFPALTLTTNIVDPGHFHFLNTGTYRGQADGTTLSAFSSGPFAVPWASNTGGGSGTVGSAFTNISANTPLGGSGTPLSRIQPSVTSDYIIKALPDDLPAGPGVTSLGGMTGAITCGANVVCNANIISVTLPAVLPVTQGGTGQSTFTPNLPLIGNGTNSILQGTVSGNTTKFGTVSGGFTPGDCLKADASGNIADFGAACVAGSTTANVQDFVAGVGFTPGTTTTLTLSATPNNAQQTTVIFDGVVQSHNTWGLATNVITFNVAIPANVNVVEVQSYVSTTTAGVANLIDQASNVASGSIPVLPPFSVAGNTLGPGGACVVKTRAAAAALDLSTCNGVVTMGYAAAGDGGGGTFQKSATPFTDSYITSLLITTAGSGCTNGTYSFVPLNYSSGSTGHGATANITVAGGIATVISIARPGNAYISGDVLTQQTTSPGFSCSGSSPTFTVIASTVTGSFTDSALNKWQLVTNPGLNVQQFGVGGTSNDTTTFQNALYACVNTGCTLTCPKGVTFTINRVFVGQNTNLLDCTIQQRTTGQNTLDLSNVSSVLISRVHMTGTATPGGGNPVGASSNSAILIRDGSSQVWVSNNDIREFLYYPVEIKSSSNIYVDKNYLFENVFGPRCSDGHFIEFTNNNLNRTALYSLTPTTNQFSVGIGLDSTDPIGGISYPPCTNVVISHNIIQGFPYAQGILVHAGSRININNNTVFQSTVGISVNPFNATDPISNISITGNDIEGTNVITLPPSSADACITAQAGGSTPNIVGISISGNAAHACNRIVQDPTLGCYQIGFTEGATISGNTADGCGANGFVFASTESGITVSGNTARNTVLYSSTQNGFSWSGSPVGSMQSNMVLSATIGYRIIGSATGLKYKDSGSALLNGCSACTTASSP